MVWLMTSQHSPRRVGHHQLMRIADFALERYFARWEFAVRHLLCASDVEGYPLAELLALADDETRGLWEGLRLGYTESTGHPNHRRVVPGPGSQSLYEVARASGTHRPGAKRRTGGGTGPRPCGR